LTLAVFFRLLDAFFFGKLRLRFCAFSMAYRNSLGVEFGVSLLGVFGGYGVPAFADSFLICPTLDASARVEADAAYQNQR